MFTNYTSSGLDTGKKVDRADGIYKVGETIYYTITVTNTGTTTLYDLIVTDEKLGLVGDKALNIGDLAPGQVVVLTGADEDDIANFKYKALTYKVKPGDEGLITNRAEISYKDKVDDSEPKTKKTNFADAFVPGLRIEKLADRSSVFVGSTIHYRIKVTNIGGVDLINVAVEDTLLGFIGSIDRLEIGDSVIFDVSTGYDLKYKATKADGETGYIDNTATASVTVERDDGDDIEIEVEDSVRVKVIKLGEGELGLQKIVRPHGELLPNFGIGYKFRVTFTYDVRRGAEADEDIKNLAALEAAWKEAKKAYEDALDELGEAGGEYDNKITDELLEEAQAAYDAVIDAAKEAVWQAAYDTAYNNLLNVALNIARDIVANDPDSGYNELWKDILEEAEAAAQQYILDSGINVADLDEDELALFEKDIEDFINFYIASQQGRLSAKLDELTVISTEDLNEIKEKAEKAGDDAVKFFQPTEEDLEKAQAAYDEVINGVADEGDEDEEDLIRLEIAMLAAQKAYEKEKARIGDVEITGDSEGIKVTDGDRNELAGDKYTKTEIEDEATGKTTTVYEITLKHDDVILFTGLPAGTAYTIEEIFDAGEDRPSVIAWDGDPAGNIPELPKGTDGAPIYGTPVVCNNIYYYITVIKSFTNGRETPITVYLDKNGVRIDQATLSAGNNWKHTFRVPDTGSYTVSEEVPANYTVRYNGGATPAVIVIDGETVFRGEVNIVNTYDEPYIPPYIPPTTTPEPITSSAPETTTAPPATTARATTTAAKETSVDGVTTEVKTTEKATTTETPPTTEPTIETEEPTSEKEPEDITDPTIPLISYEPTTEGSIDEITATVPHISAETEPAPIKPNPQTGVNMLAILLLTAAMGISAATFMYARKKVK